jgi:hypothetical protein
MLDRCLQRLSLFESSESPAFRHGEYVNPGTQIILVPSHADGNVEHEDCEVGFVTSVSPSGTVFCRFWSKRNPGMLRTVANSEGCSPDDLIAKDTTLQTIVDAKLLEIDMTTKFGAVWREERRLAA